MNGFEVVLKNNCLLGHFAQPKPEKYFGQKMFDV